MSTSDDDTLLGDGFQGNIGSSWFNSTKLMTRWTEPAGSQVPQFSAQPRCQVAKDTKTTACMVLMAQTCWAIKGSWLISSMSRAAKKYILKHSSKIMWKHSAPNGTLKRFTGVWILSICLKIRHAIFQLH